MTLLGLAWLAYANVHGHADAVMIRASSQRSVAKEGEAAVAAVDFTVMATYMKLFCTAETF